MQPSFLVPSAISEFADYASGKKRYAKPAVSLMRQFFALPSYHLILWACLVILFAHMMHIPVWLTGLCVASIIAQLPSIKCRLQQKLNLKKSYQGVQLVLFFLGVVGLLVSFRQPFSTDMSISFLVLCLFCKLWELNNKRDGYIVLNLCLFVLASAFLWSQELALALLSLFGLSVVMLGFVALSDESNRLGVGRLRTLGFLMLPSVPLLVVLFLFFPRLPPLWSLSMSGQQATTGVSDSMSPGDFANLSKSAELAFRAEFTGALPERSQMYWRGLVFTDFDGVTWRPSKTRGRFVRSTEAPPDWAKLRGNAGSYQIRLEPTYQHWLYVLEHSYPKPQRGVSLSDKFTVGSYQPIGTQFGYQAEYYPAAKVGLSLNHQELEEALALPNTGNENARQLGKSLFEQANGDTAKMVELFRQYILDKEFSYTLSPPVLQDNRIDEFLFGSKAGFCEHYASSFVFVMRSAGVPARVVAGYQGGELGRDGTSWEVRQMDAHAWAEIWIANEGWVRVDPTGFVSPNRIFDGMNAVTETAGAQMFGDGVIGQIGYQQFRLLQSMYRFSDQMSYYWQKQVVGFDQEAQKNSLLQWFNIASLTQQILVLAISFGGMIGLIAVVFWYKRRVVYDVMDAPIAKLSKRLAKKDQTLAKYPHESYLGYLKRLNDRLGGGYEELIADYRAYRFGQGVDGKINDFVRQVEKFGHKF